MGKCRFLVFIAVFLLLACSNQSKDELLESGIGHLNAGNTRGAVVYLKKALELDPNYYEARYYLGDAYLQVGQYQQAEHEFEKVLRQNSSYSDLQLKFALVYRHTDRLDKAIETLELFHQQNQPSSASLDLLGVVNSLKQEFKIADSLFKQAAALDPKKPLPVFHLAQSYLSQSLNSQASTVLEQMLVDFPNFSPAYKLLAELHLSQNRIEDAITIYHRQYQADPANIQALYMRGLLLLTIDRTTEAVGVVETITARFPNDYRGQQLLGMVAYKSERYDEALVYLRQSLKAQPHALTYYYLGLSHFQQKEYELAINQYQRILDEQPDSSQARLMLAMTFLLQKRVDDCLRQIRYVLKNDPQNGLAYNLLGSAQLLLKEYDKALAAFNRALEINPGLVDVYLKKGQAHMVRGEADMAERALVNAVSNAPHVLNTRLILASHYSRTGKYAEASEVLLDGLTESSADALLYRLLAGIAFKQGREEQFVAYLEKAKLAEPTYLSPYFSLAAHYQVKGDYDLAVAEYRALLAKQADNVRAMVELGLLYELNGDAAKSAALFAQLPTIGRSEALLEFARYKVRTGQREAARQAVDQGLALEPESVPLIRLQIQLSLQLGQVDTATRLIGQLEQLVPGSKNSMLVNILIKQNDSASATAIAESVLKSKPTQPEGYLLLASVLEAKGETEQAKATIENGLAACSDDAALLLRLALLHEQSGDIEGAMVFYRELLQKHPQSLAGQFAFAALQDRLGNSKAARHSYEKAIAINQNFVPALNNMAYLLAVSDDDAYEALSLILRAYRLAPGESGVLDTLGVVLLKNGRAGEAVHALTRAQMLAADNPTICFHLAQAYMELDRPDKAQSELERALEFGSFPEAAECQTLLNRIKG